MFTGIIEETGRVERIRAGQAATEFTVHAPKLARGISIGGSLAVNGACLTAVQKRGSRLRFDVLNQTLRCTNFGNLSTGDLVNLERPLRVGARLDGHFVLGHVDAAARVRRFEKVGPDYLLEIALSKRLRPYLVDKGSIAVDGISLTVAELRAAWLRIWIIPHTRRVTNLARKRKGDLVNLEVDMLGKYVVRFMEQQSR